MLIEYPYLFGSLILLIVWLLIYAYRKDLRHQMLWFSPAVAIFGIISEHWFLVDYWNPPVIFHFPFNLGSPEDLIFGFAVGGIVCSLYEIVFNKRTSPANPKNRVWTAVKYGVFIFAFVEILTRMYLVNSIFAFALASLAGALIILFNRSKMFPSAVCTAVLFTLIYSLTLTFIVPAVMPYLGYEAWFLQGTSLGYLIFGRIPLTEVIWALSWGFFGSLWYDDIANLKYYRAMVKAKN